MTTDMTLDFSEEEVQLMLDNLDEYSSEEVAELDRLVSELEVRKQNKLAYDDLIEFPRATVSPSLYLSCSRRGFWGETPIKRL